MKKYTTPIIEIINLNPSDIIQTSAVDNIDTANYGFTTVTVHEDQGQKWLDSWNR